MWEALRKGDERPNEERLRKALPGAPVRGDGGTRGLGGVPLTDSRPARFPGAGLTASPSPPRAGHWAAPVLPGTEPERGD